jgi:hypothetical protein
MFKIKMCVLAVLVVLSGRVFAQGESAVPFLLNRTQLA